MKYLPFLTGIYSVAPGLIPLSRTEHEQDRLIFQLDEQYENYLFNKAACRKEDIRKYYREHNLPEQTRRCIITYIASQLQKEHPHYFRFDDHSPVCRFLNNRTHERLEWDKESLVLKQGKYISVFDALCSQVQEDIAVCQLQDEKDWIAAIHVCSPNHWSPAEKAGKTFDVVHAPVAGMQKSFPHYFKMLQSVVGKGPFTRFAWGIATDKQLNHHPQPPYGVDESKWRGRQITKDASLFIRTEKQNLVGFPAINAFLFTIRTYFYDVASLQQEEKKQLWAAVQTMSPASLEYKELAGSTAILFAKLFNE